jgi:hypothetical protein
MNQINLTVTGNHLEISKDAKTTEGCVNYDKCQFTFDSEWSSFTKIAVFACSDTDSYRVSINDNSCFIPAACIENDGIIRIGVYGINDSNTVIATNSVAHHVEEGIDSVNEWIEEDSSLVINAINELKIYAAEYTDTLDKKFASLLKKVEESGTIQNTFGTYIFPDDWYHPETYMNAANCPIASTGSTYDDFLNFMLKALLEEYPEYVSKKEIGKDASNTYSIYSYSFEPQSYDKTVLITSCVHGSDRIAMQSLCYFLDRLCRTADKNSTLNYIKSKIKLVVVPIVNPYGLMKTTSYNANNINLGYNFPYNWSVCTRSNKGSAAADQVETQNIISLLSTLSNDKLCAALDLHTSATTIAGRSVFYPKLHSNCATALADLVNNFNFDALSTDLISKAVLVPSNNPTLTNYAAETYGINSCELIWSNSAYGGIFNNESMTKLTEFIGNSVYVMSKSSRVSHKTPPSAFIKQISWNKNSDTDVFNITSTAAYEKMGISAYSLKLAYPCNISMNGYITLSLSSACTVKINPVLCQTMSSELEYSNRIASAQFSHELTLSAGVHVIPISSVLQAYFTSYNVSSDCAYCEDVKFVLAFSASVSGAAAVTAYSVTFNATPSDLAKPVEICRPMGNVSDYTANDIPTQTVIYPLGTYTDNDQLFND